MSAPGKLTSPSIIKALLDSLDHRPNKGLGQNYLIDSNILGIIVAAAEISPHDQLLEVGPGLGALTQALLATGAKLIAVELWHRTMSASRTSSAVFPSTGVRPAKRWGCKS